MAHSSRPKKVEEEGVELDNLDQKNNVQDDPFIPDDPSEEGLFVPDNLFDEDEFDEGEFDEGEEGLDRAVLSPPPEPPNRVAVSLSKEDQHTLTIITIEDVKAFIKENKDFKYQKRNIFMEKKELEDLKDLDDLKGEALYSFIKENPVLTEKFKNAYIYIRGKPGGQNKPGKHGGVYRKVSDGSNYLFKQDTKYNYIKIIKRKWLGQEPLHRVEKDISEFVATRMASTIFPKVAPEIAVKKHPNQQSPYIGSKFFGGGKGETYVDLYVDVYQNYYGVPQLRELLSELTSTKKKLTPEQWKELFKKYEIKEEERYRDPAYYSVINQLKEACIAGSETGAARENAIALINARLTYLKKHVSVLSERPMYLGLKQFYSSHSKEGRIFKDAIERKDIVEDKVNDEKRQELRYKGIEKCLVLSALFADNDVHTGNIGVVITKDEEGNEKRECKRIDFGAALVGKYFNMEKGLKLGSAQRGQFFKADPTNHFTEYPKSIVYTTEFADSIQETVKEMRDRLDEQLQLFKSEEFKLWPYEDRVKFAKYIGMKNPHKYEDRDLNTHIKNHVEAVLEHRMMLLERYELDIRFSSHFEVTEDGKLKIKDRHKLKEFIANCRDDHPDYFKKVFLGSVTSQFRKGQLKLRLSNVSGLNALQNVRAKQYFEAEILSAFNEVNLEQGTKPGIEKIIRVLSNSTDPADRRLSQLVATHFDKLDDKQIKLLMDYIAKGKKTDLDNKKLYGEVNDLTQLLKKYSNNLALEQITAITSAIERADDNSMLFLLKKYVEEFKATMHLTVTDSNDLKKAEQLIKQAESILDDKLYEDSGPKKVSPGNRKLLSELEYRQAILLKRPIITAEYFPVGLPPNHNLKKSYDILKPTIVIKEIDDNFKNDIKDQLAYLLNIRNKYATDPLFYKLIQDKYKNEDAFVSDLVSKYNAMLIEVEARNQNSPKDEKELNALRSSIQNGIQELTKPIPTPPETKASWQEKRKAKAVLDIELAMIELKQAMLEFRVARNTAQIQPSVIAKNKHLSEQQKNDYNELYKAYKARKIDNFNISLIAPLIGDYQVVREKFEHVNGKIISKTEVESSDASDKRVLEILGKKGYEILHPDRDQKESTVARELFMHALQNALDERRKKGMHNKPISMKELLGEEGIKLYKAAMKEEAATKAFKNAVFLRSVKTHFGPKWLKRLVLWVAGPSASGKTFATDGMIAKIANLIPTNRREPYVENHVVTIDGAIEREVSQVRQLTVQVALELGTTGIDDLEDHSKSKLKEKIHKAVDTNPKLHLAIPETFTKFTGKLDRNLRSEFDKYAGKQNMQIFSQVVCGDSTEAKDNFQESVRRMGSSRAFLKNGTVYSGISINNFYIGCESKKYKAGTEVPIPSKRHFIKFVPINFHLGKRKRTAEIYESSVELANREPETKRIQLPDNVVPVEGQPKKTRVVKREFEIVNDLVYVMYDDINKKWRPCTKDDEGQVIMTTARAFKAWLESKECRDANNLNREDQYDCLSAWIATNGARHTEPIIKYYENNELVNLEEKYIEMLIDDYRTSKEEHIAIHMNDLLNLYSEVSERLQANITVGEQNNLKQYLLEIQKDAGELFKANNNIVDTNNYSIMSWEENGKTEYFMVKKQDKPIEGGEAYIYFGYKIDNTGKIIGDEIVIRNLKQGTDLSEEVYHSKAKAEIKATKVLYGKTSNMITFPDGTVGYYMEKLPGDDFAKKWVNDYKSVLIYKDKDEFGKDKEPDTDVFNTMKQSQIVVSKYKIYWLEDGKVKSIPYNSDEEREPDISELKKTMQEGETYLTKHKMYWLENGEIKSKPYSSKNILYFYNAPLVTSELSTDTNPDAHDLIRRLKERSFCRYGRGFNCETFNSLHLSFKQRSQVIRDILEQLQEFHAAGYYHGDINPTNIKIYKDDGNICAKIFDFGQSGYLAGASSLKLEEVIGMPEFAAPESVSDKQYGKASDVFSMAAIIGMVFSNDPNAFIAKKLKVGDDLEKVRQRSNDERVTQASSVDYDYVDLLEGLVVDQGSKDSITSFLKRMTDADLSKRPSITDAFTFFDELHNKLVQSEQKEANKPAQVDEPVIKEEDILEAKVEEEPHVETVAAANAEVELAAQKLAAEAATKAEVEKAAAEKMLEEKKAEEARLVTEEAVRIAKEEAERKAAEAKAEAAKAEAAKAEAAKAEAAKAEAAKAEAAKAEAAKAEAAKAEDAKDQAAKETKTPEDKKAEDAKVDPKHVAKVVRPIEQTKEQIDALERKEHERKQSQKLMEMPVSEPKEKGLKLKGGTLIKHDCRKVKERTGEEAYFYEKKEKDGSLSIITSKPPTKLKDDDGLPTRECIQYVKDQIREILKIIPPPGTIIEVYDASLLDAYKLICDQYNKEQNAIHITFVNKTGMPEPDPRLADKLEEKLQKKLSTRKRMSMQGLLSMLGVFSHKEEKPAYDPPAIERFLLKTEGDLGLLQTNSDTTTIKRLDSERTTLTKMKSFASPEQDAKIDLLIARINNKIPASNADAYTPKGRKENSEAKRRIFR